MTRERKCHGPNDRVMQKRGGSVLCNTSEGKGSSLRSMVWRKSMTLNGAFSCWRRGSKGSCSCVDSLVPSCVCSLQKAA